MVVHDGMQSHCGMLASNTREFSFADVKSNFLLATCTFCTGYYAKFLGDETCHIMPNEDSATVCQRLEGPPRTSAWYQLYVEATR